MEIKFKTWLEKDGEAVAGHGQINFLKSIDETGSIQKAAAKMGISYRHAWGFIRKIEQHAGTKLVKTLIGGKEGGGARLTPAGKTLVEQYCAFQDGLKEYIHEKFKTAFSRRPSAVGKRK